MDTHSFLLYGSAASALVWALLGLRFGLSVFAANSLLLLLWRLFPGIGPGAPATPALVLVCLVLWPALWGAAFLLLKTERLPALPAGLRVCCGLALCAALCAAANWEPLTRAGRLTYALYVGDTKERPARITAFFATASYAEVCLESHPTLMRLAVATRDLDGARALLRAFERCKTASATMTEAVRPLIDAGDESAVAFLLKAGLRPSSLLFGGDYANGTALAYAAVEGKAELARLIIRHDPDDARSLRYLPLLLSTLRDKGDEDMLRLLEQEGLRPPDANAPDSADMIPAPSPIPTPAYRF